MKKLKQALSVISVLIIITSCSNNQKNIKDKWWTKGYNNSIIMFTSNNKVIRFGDNEENFTDYKISSSKIEILKDNEVQHITTIVSATDSSLVLIEGETEEIELRLATDRDFLTSEWIGKMNNTAIKVSFENTSVFSNSLAFIVNGINNIITLNSNNLANIFDENLNISSFKYELSKDKNNLILKENGVIVYNINRASSNLELINEDLAEVIITETDFILNNLLKIKSESELISVFGNNVISSMKYSNDDESGEEYEYPITTLYPNTPNEVVFNWENAYSGLLSIAISNQDGKWKTNEGIKIGTTLKELEIFNKNPFSFYGFDMDEIPVGKVDDFQGGILNSKKMKIEFNHTSDLSGIGFDAILSSTGIAQKANPTIKSISLIVN